MGRGAPPEASGTREQGRGRGAALGALCLLPLLLLARLGAPGARPAAGGAQGVLTAVPPAAGVSTAGLPGFPGPPAPRRRRYTLTPARLRWDHFNLTYRILSFPRNLLSPSETRRGLAAAFRLWSEVSPFSFREVAPSQPSDLRIGFYPVNHTDCLSSALHHCFDGPTGELAHAFFPPHGGIHFDDSEYWVLGPTRYSWKKGRAVGAAPALRLPGPALRVRVVGAEGLLRRPPPAHEEALPQQLRLLLRVPLPHAGCHPTAPPDENQAGVRRQERDLPLRPEAPPQERQSVLVQGPGAPRVLLPRLPGAGRGPAEHHRQRHQRGRLLVRGAPRPPRAHLLLVARAPAELTAADKGFLSDTSVPFLGGHGRRPGQRGGPTRPRELEGARHPSFPSPQFPARVCSAELNRGRARALWEGKGCAGGAQGSARRQGRLPVRVAWARQGVGCGLSRSPKPILMDCGARGPLAPA
nr:matrix metalloproteinase-23 isoform X2 [Dasypus novemcinctus]